MEGQREKLLEKLDKLDQELTNFWSALQSYEVTDITKKPAPGVWSPAEVILHLLKSEELTLGYLNKKLSFNPDLPKAGLGAMMRAMLLTLYLRSPLRAKAPGFADPASQTKMPSVDELKDRWMAFRRDFRHYLQTVDEKWLDREAFRHPLAGRLSFAQTLHFFGEHFRHHQKQVFDRLPEKGVKAGGW